MSIFTILTLIFVTLKLTGFIEWSWLLVLTPSIIYIALWLAVTIWWESKTPIEKARFKLGIND